MIIKEYLPQGNEVSLFNNVVYNVPGLFQFSSLIYKYIDVVKSRYNYNLPIKYIYGAPNCIWNGGRIIFTDSRIYDSFEVELYNTCKYKLVPLITFSNLKITNDLLLDEIGNRLLNILNNISGGVIVSSPLLEKYIRDNFKNIKIHASVVKTSSSVRNVRYYQSLSNNYDCYVLHPDDNVNYDLLSQIPTHNAEILINERCYPECKQRHEYYISISNEQLSLCEGSYKYENFLSGCSAIPEWKQLNSKTRNISCTLEELALLNNLGVKIFKIQGRTDNLYSVFFDLMRYTLENKIAFPTLYPLFCHEIEKFKNQRN